MTTNATTTANTTAQTTPPDIDGPPLTATYIAVIVVEVLIVAGLWALGRMFA